MPPAFPPALATGVGACLAFFGLVLLARSLRRRVPPARWETCSDAALPHDVAREASPWLARLAYFGFRPAAVLQSLSTQHAEGFRWLLINEIEKSFATLDRLVFSSGAYPRMELSFFTAARDGTVQVTLDRTGLIHYPAYWILRQKRYRRLELQWREHQALLPNVDQRLLPSASQLPALLGADEAARHDALRSTGEYLETPDQTLKPRWQALSAHFVRACTLLLRGGSKARIYRRDLASAPAETEFPPPPVSIDEAVEMDLKRYRSLSNTRHPGDFIRRWLMVATTVAAFTLVFGREAPVFTAVAVLCLCALHEAGHWLAMRACGFRGLLPFFIPFSGDVDRARKLHAPPWQHLLVLLAGPLPGLLLGGSVFAWVLTGHQLSPWILDAAGLAVVMNCIHLLPFLPLDGGKIADLLFFRDLPWIRPFFTLFSGAAALTGALALKSRLLRQVSFALFGGVIWDLRTISVIRGARRIAWAGELDDEDEALRRAFRSVREEGNSGFVGSFGWHHKVDAMLVEVLRRRPSFGTRLFGGGFYAAACLAPALVIAGLLALPYVPRSLHGSDPDLAREFREVFPSENDAAVNPSAVVELEHATEGAISAEHSEDSSRMIARLTPVLSEALGKLDWSDAGIMLRKNELRPPIAGLWLGVMTAQMEAANEAGRQEDAVLRAEILLHALSKLEPAPSLSLRQKAQDAEERTLTVIELQSATGKIEVKHLQAIRDRINLLNRQPRPEVDDFLLVQDWMERRRVEILREDQSRPAKDICFWRDIPRRTQRLKTFFASPSLALTPAPVAVARLWKQTSRVGELPPFLDSRVSVTESEAALIYRFCERQRDLTWRRITTLTALRLECYRQQNGKFPPIVRNSVPGGASLELVKEGGPWLRLTDLRYPSERQAPAWLIPDEGRDLPPSPALDHQCPLFGSPQVTDVSMQ